MAEYDFVCVDVETTGLNHQNDEILEVTAIEFNLNGNIGRVFTQLCRPMLGHVPAHITKINNITWDMVKDKPNYLEGKIREEVAVLFGKRTVIGHNVINFDIKFLRIKARKMEDTLAMCRKRYPGGNKLKTACLRMGIKWNDKEAHRSEYDVKKCIELFVKLKTLDRKEEEQKQEAPLFSQQVEQGVNVVGKVGVVPSDLDKNVFATQAYSYSRINLFHQCKFKWYMQYIKKARQPEVSYLTTGSICHKIAEWSGQWCYRELLANKLTVYANVKNLSLNNHLAKNIAKEFGIEDYEDVTFHDAGKFFFKYPKEIPNFFIGKAGLADLIFEIDESIEDGTYERPSMPDGESYEKIIRTAITAERCTDADVIKDVRYIMGRFYESKDFSMVPGDIILTEKRLAFDKDWKLLKDFYSNLAFMRGIIDVIAYIKNCVVITDYKTSRKWLTVEQLREDMQIKLYVLLVYHFMPPGSYNKIIARVEFIRFGKTVEYEITDVKSVADEALSWVMDSIKQIESEMLKVDGNAFEPQRNEYCHTCFLGEEGRCPLFDKRFINNINDVDRFKVTDIEDCQTAWKRVEVNKAENKRLTNQCKTFVNGCSDAIKIDTHATLDYYVEEKRNYLSVAAMKLLLMKKVPIDLIIKYFSITEKSFDDLLEKSKVELTDEELGSISKVKKRTTFDAFTVKEAKGKNFLNA